jgi:hypothetical protein
MHEWPHHGRGNRVLGGMQLAYHDGAGTRRESERGHGRGARESRPDERVPALIRCLGRRAGAQMAMQSNHMSIVAAVTLLRYDKVGNLGRLGISQAYEPGFMRRPGHPGRFAFGRAAITPLAALKVA